MNLGCIFVVLARAAVTINAVLTMSSFARQVVRAYNTDVRIPCMYE